MPPRDARTDSAKTRAERLVERTCREQGIPTKVNDPSIVARVVAILGQAPADDEKKTS